MKIEEMQEQKINETVELLKLFGMPKKQQTKKADTLPAF